MEIGDCSATALALLGTILVIGLSFSLSMWIGRQRQYRRMVEPNDGPKVTLASRLQHVKWEKAPHYVTAASLLFAATWAYNNVTIVPCGEGEVAIIEKPIEMIVKATTGCECCGQHLAMKEE